MAGGGGWYSSGVEHLTADQEVPGSGTGTKVVNKGTNVDQCNRIESPEINSGVYSQLLCNTGGSIVQTCSFNLKEFDFFPKNNF